MKTSQEAVQAETVKIMLLGTVGEAFLNIAGYKKKRKNGPAKKATALQVQAGCVMYGG